MTEEEFIYKAQNGERDAFGVLYENHFTKIYRFIFIKVGRKHDAEDISHQVFLNAWKNISRYDQRGLPFSSWLYKIASNAVIDFYRTSKDYIDIDLVSEEKFPEIKNQNNELELKMEMERVGKAIRNLKDDEQSVIIMKFINELSNKEIGEILGKTEGAIRVIQHRGLRTLKTLLEKDQNNNE